VHAFITICELCAFVVGRVQKLLSHIFFFYLTLNTVVVHCKSAEQLYSLSLKQSKWWWGHKVSYMYRKRKETMKKKNQLLLWWWWWWCKLKSFCRFWKCVDWYACWQFCAKYAMILIVDIYVIFFSITIHRLHGIVMQKLVPATFVPENWRCRFVVAKWKKSRLCYNISNPFDIAKIYVTFRYVAIRL
jgi:hypothetical protein